MYIAELQEMVSMEGQLADELPRMAEGGVPSVSETRVDASSRGNADPKGTTRINLAKAWCEPTSAYRPSHAGACK